MEAMALEARWGAAQPDTKVRVCVSGGEGEAQREGCGCNQRVPYLEGIGFGGGRGPGGGVWVVEARWGAAQPDTKVRVVE